MILLFLILICRLLSINGGFINYKQYMKLNQTCVKTWKFFELYYNVSKITRDNFRKSRLDVCDFPQSKCCYESIESKLIDEANRNFFKNPFLTALQPIKNSFVELTSNFDHLVKKLLENSFQELSSLLKKSNFRQIEKNIEIIFDFYSSLKSYFSEYQVDLVDIILRTFLNLYTINLDKAIKQINLTDSCLIQNFDFIKPFGSDIIKEIESRIKSSLESAKIFSTGLTKARDILLEITNKIENPSTECKKIVTSITTCSLCISDEFYNEKINIKPCYQTCIQVYKSCFTIDLGKFDNVWNSFLVLMNKLSFHIEYTVNFPNSVNEIKYQLIDGISYFNTNRKIIISELLERCKNNTVLEKLIRSSTSKKFYYNKRFVDLDEANMHKYFLRVANFFKEINGLWKFLISDACKAIAPKSNRDNCWLGTRFRNKIENFEDSLTVNLWSNEDSLQIKKTLDRQSETLKLFNKKLYKFLNKKSTKNSRYLDNSHVFNNKKDLDEIAMSGNSKFDYFNKDFIKNNLFVENDNQLKNLNHNQEFYYEYGEYYYDQIGYENDYFDIHDNSFLINKSNSKMFQILRERNHFLYSSNQSNLILIQRTKKEIFFLIFAIFYFLK